MSGSSTHSSSPLPLRLLCWSTLLPLALLLRSLVRARHRKPEPTFVPLSALLREQNTVFMKRAELRMRHLSTLPPTDPLWAAGSGLQGELAGSGLRWGPSCWSSTPSPKGTPMPAAGYTRGSCSSVNLGGSGNGTPSADPSISTMEKALTTPTDGGLGRG
jgi:hypothetical protein